MEDKDENNDMTVNDLDNLIEQCEECGQSKRIISIPDKNTMLNILSEENENIKLKDRNTQAAYMLICDNCYTPPLKLENRDK